MIFPSKTNTAFGFQFDSMSDIEFFEWDEAMLQNAIHRFGQKSVESSLKFSETND